MWMMSPPQSVKIVSTPSLFSALATRWPPETTLASRVLRFSVSSAVVDAGAAGALIAVTKAMSRSLRLDIERLQLIRIKARLFGDRLDEVLADPAFHLAINRQQRPFPLGAFLRRKPDDLRLAAALDRVQRIDISARGDVVRKHGRLSEG